MPQAHNHLPALGPHCHPVLGPQCAYQVQAATVSSSANWRQQYVDRGRDATKCLRPSAVTVGGIGYCRQHAGQVVLAQLLAGQNINSNDLTCDGAEHQGGGTLSTLAKAELRAIVRDELARALGTMEDRRGA